MRLKSLTLHGYKTFASKTTFLFGEGITAIIGPNGSGKSNIADAIRWALGEQQFSLLRVKKTEDMLFAGSAKRPRASFAEVSLVFDNSDQFFPIAYSEIEIVRRAYRDGANEYALNGNRVRLRDIADLLVHSGLAERTYTVIGQGLVDYALAQKPEERRALFEEAAGISVYRSRREEALRKLEETRHNLERVQDILREVEPRLRQLAQQAERARRHRELRQALLEQSQRWLSWQYHTLQDKLRLATAARDFAQHQQAQARLELEAAAQRLAALRDQRAQLQAQIADAQRECDATQRTYNTWLRERDVLRERLAALEHQEADLQAELQALATEHETAQQLVAEAARTMQEARIAHEQLVHTLQQALDKAALHNQERERLEATRHHLQQALALHNRALAEAQHNLVSLQTRQRNLRDQLDSLSQRAAEVSARREAHLAALQQLQEAIQHDSAQATVLDAQYESAQHALEEAQRQLSQAQAALAAAEAEEKLVARMALFTQRRVQQQAEDLATAAATLGLDECRGLLSDWLQVPPEVQQAVRAALGQWLNALLVDAGAPSTAEPWPRLRSWLRAQSAGALAVAPLHALRNLSPSLTESQHEHMRSLGIRPVVEVLSGPDWLRPALLALFGDTFLAPDLDAAMRFARLLEQHVTCITYQGDIVFANGGVILRTSSADEFCKPLVPVSDSAPDPQATRAQLELARAAHRDAQECFAQARRNWEEAALARQSFTQEALTRQRRLEEMTQEVARDEETLTDLGARMAQLEQEVTALEGPIAQATLRVQQHQQALAQAQAALDAAAEQLNEFLRSGEAEAIARLRAEVAAALQAIASAEALHQARARHIATLEAQQAARAERLRAVRADRAAVLLRYAEAEQALAQSADQLQRTLEAIRALHDNLAESDRQADMADTQRHQLEQQLRAHEAQLSAAVLELTRLEDEQRSLVQRASELLIERLDSAEADPMAATAALLAALPPEPPSAHAEAHIAQLRRQIRQLGAINEEAEAEHAALRERYDFLTAQCADLEQAAERLQQAIAEMNEIMHKAFRETFDAIAAAFQHTFKALFGGGQARLSLMNADDLDACGVEIHAQPPGKRPQSLALLSGGERSLTAAALLFAILQVKPTPFCVLDEIDAALDESNVGRIREMLERLSEQTQFIIITHNRHTVEAADTIYGISMGTDGASAVLSLRLNPA